MTNNDHGDEDDEDDEEDEDDGDVVSGKNWAEWRGKGTLFVPLSHKIRPFLKFWWFLRNYLWIALLLGGDMFTSFFKTKSYNEKVLSNEIKCSFTFLPNMVEMKERDDEISNIYVHNVLSPKSQ